ncbi:MmgE/PrpD family protein [Paraburkholderia sp. MM6662-R1]|uniref:MmgE/PrpD family protein n=1 Tax=Paraburkholderia sp. MM6662-R1 TaxID=2991066 RepID=UPI003D1A95C7
MSTPLTRDLAAFVATLSFDALPAEAVATAKLAFLDATGVMLAGKDEPCVTVLINTLEPSAGDASLFCGPQRVRAPEAAWINAVATHALDFDDTALSAHPSAVMVPAIVAEGEHLGSSGRDMICAYVAGFEVWAEIKRREAGQHHLKGWHPTGIIGAIAAAAACAYLRRLDVDQVVNALALGASQSAGITANFGTMAKPFHAGRAAHAGVLAARLAQNGMTASSDALEHAQGFLTAVSPSGQVDRVSPCEVGKNWASASIGLHIKKYPTCYCSHRPIDAMLSLREMHPEFAPDDVEEIVVSMSRRNAMVLRNARPKTGLEAKFSIEFVLSCALIVGRVGLSELDNAVVLRKDIQAMMERVRTVYDPCEDPSSGYAPFDQVAVVLRDGRTIESEPVALARGAAGAPLSDEEVRSKFLDCTSRTLDETTALGLYVRLKRLDTLDRIGAAFVEADE